MIKQLPLLRGWAILGVVCNHATAQVFLAMFWWVHRYRPVTSPNYDQFGTPTYYVIMAISQLVLFCVPGFFFISGFFVTYAAQGNPPVLSWKAIRARLRGLFWPFLIWSFIVLTSDVLLDTFLPQDSNFNLLTRNIFLFYFFVPLLAQFYIASPLLLRWARSRPGLLLVSCALLQSSVVIARYLVLAGVTSDLAEIIAETPLWLFVRWALYFPLGIVVGAHRRKFSSWLARFKWHLVTATLVLGTLAVLECDWLYRTTDNWNWAYDSPKLSVNLYAVAFIFAFLASKPRRNVLSRTVDQIGRMSYGIYLIQGTALMLTAKIIYHVAPGIMAWALLLQLLLVTVAVGSAWLLMTLVARSPMRKLYPFLFG